MQFSCQFNALRFTTGQGSRRLAKPHISQTHLNQRVQVAADGGDGFEELCGFTNRHVQNLRDGLAFVFHFQGLPVVTGTLADFTRHIHVRQEVHFDLESAIAVTCLASPAFNVEGEPTRLVATDLRLTGFCKQCADLVKHACVGGGIGTRGTPDGRLIHLH